MSETGDTMKTDDRPGGRLREQATAVKEDVRELGRLAKEASRDKLRETKQVAGEYVARGQQRAGEIEDSVVTYVRDNPVKSLLMAAGAGVLIGFLFSRR